VSGSGSPPEQTPASAVAVFGPRLGLAEQFAHLLVTDAVVRGIVGPREPERIWTRHLLNCAVITELFPAGARIVDVGSGAGLPGIAVALRRPDLRVDLVEPLLRRAQFLVEVIERLGLIDQVRVVRGRADAPTTRREVGAAAWVTARAVTSLDRLVNWCLPLLATDGRLALMKGANAADEIEQYRPVVTRAGATAPILVHCGVGLVDPAVPVVVVGRRAP
jgi:16S rRNA (guanine527-N7)-methyltransferase